MNMFFQAQPRRFEPKFEDHELARPLQHHSGGLMMHAEGHY
jgi:hypothetical protein